MSLLNTLSIGKSGLQSTSQKMNQVSENITNSGTSGYKKSTANFEEMLLQSMDENSNVASSMAGSKMANKTMNMSQGDIVRSGSNTDMAVSGKGFFKVETSSGSAYTRDGSFQFNKDGELVNSDGHKIIGFKVGANGQVSSAQSPIKLDVEKIPGAPTTQANMILNLDARSEIKVFDPANPKASSNYSNTIKVYDNNGNPRYTTVYYTKVAEGQWTYNAMIDGEDFPGGQKGQEYPAGSGTLQFSPEGRLQAATPISSAFNFKDSGAQNINFNFGESLASGADGTNAATAFGTKSGVSKFSVDGTEAGDLKSVGFGPDGMLQLHFDNGTIKDIAQVALADFTNEQGLRRIGSNLYVETSKSGQAALGKPGEEGRGNIQSQSLEMSNVDIANEYVDLMSTQQSFQANSKTMSVTDELLQKVINVRG